MQSRCRRPRGGEDGCADFVAGRYLLAWPREMSDRGAFARATSPEKRVANRKRDVEVAGGHSRGVVVSLVMGAELPQRRPPGDPRVLRQVVAEVEPLVGEEVAHGGGHVEPRHVARGDQE